MQTVTLQLTVDAVNAILSVLGDLPTKMGAYPLLMEIKKQADEQVKETEDGNA